MEPAELAGVWVQSLKATSSSNNKVNKGLWLVKEGRVVVELESSPGTWSPHMVMLNLLIGSKGSRTDHGEFILDRESNDSLELQEVAGRSTFLLTRL
jgi:hypothetical protein